MAQAYARLAAAPAAGDARDRALARIRGAMSTFPLAIGGEGRLSTMLMQASAGRLVAKGGAEGLQCVAIPHRGLGIALKCEDGAGRAVGPATIAVFPAACGMLDPRLLPLAAHPSSETVHVWASFRDKGAAGPIEMAAALERAAATLEPRDRARRLPAHVTPLVDELDLPVCPRYL